MASETTAHRVGKSIDPDLLEVIRAAGTYKGGFGFFPLLCYLAETGEPLAERSTC